MRNFEGNFGWLDELAARHDVTVVVSTFSQRGGKLFGDLSGVRARDLLPYNLSDALPPTWIGNNLPQYLPGILEKAKARGYGRSITPERVQQVIPGAIVHVEDNIRIGWFEVGVGEGSTPKHPDPFSMQMLYKIWRADLLRQNIELDLGQKFDAVVRLRPDRPLIGLDDDILGRLRPGLVICESVRHREKFIGDQFAIADSDTMTIYSSMFFHAYPKAMRSGWDHIHTEMFEYLSGASVEIDEYNPMLDFAADRLIEVEDVLAALENNTVENRGDLFGFGPLNRQDTSSLSKIISVCEALSKGILSLTDTRLIESVVSIGMEFNPDRDAGFFYYLARNFAESIVTEDCLISIFLSFTAIWDPYMLRGVHAYIVQFCIRFEQLAKARGAVPLGAAEFLNHCVTAETLHPLHGALADLLSTPQWFDRAATHLERIIGFLFDTDPGFWSRIAAHMVAHGAAADAESVLRRTVAAAPSHCTSWLQLAQLLEARGALQEAAEAARAALTLEPDHPEVRRRASAVIDAADRELFTGAP